MDAPSADAYIARGERSRCAARSALSVAFPLLEREDEVHALDGLLQDGLSGDAVLAMIEGPAGIGKSRLLAHAREQAATAGHRVLSARGSELERDYSFGVVRQLFEPLLAEPGQRDRWLSGAAGPAARVFVPPDEGAPGGDVSYGVLHALFGLVANIAADGPLLLAIDDLHWCDRASVRFVAYLSSRLEGLPVVVASAVRTGEPPVEALLLDEIAHGPAAVTVRLLPLTEAGSADLVRVHLGAGAEPAFWQACHQATGGNPLLLGELLKTLRTERVVPAAAHVDVVRAIGPRAVSRTVLLRLSRLSSDAVAVARAVAVLGSGASVPTVAALSGLVEPAVADAAVDLSRAEILRPEPPLAFVHPLVRDAVYHDLRPSERERDHERAATLLRDGGASPELVAAHLLLSGRRLAWASEVLREAGQAASARGDTDAAVSYLRLALEGSDDAARRPQLLFELAVAEANIDAAAAGRDMREAYDGLTEPLARAFAATVLARMLLFTGTGQEAVDVVREAAAQLPAELVGFGKAYQAFELYCVAFGADVPDASARLAQVRAEGVGGSGVGAGMLRAVASWDCAMNGGPAEGCVALALEALEGGALIAADAGFGPVIAGGVLGLADREEAVVVWDTAMAEAERLGSPRTVCMVAIWKGMTLLHRGELAAADATLADAARQMETLETNGAGMAYIASFLARVRIHRGELAGAREALARARDDLPPSDGASLVRRSTIELLLAEERWAEARSAVEEYRRGLRGERNPSWAPWRSLEAQALVGLGHREQAVALLEDELDLARTWGAPGALGHALRLLGTMRGTDGLRALEDAVDVTEGTAAHLEHARALVALGAAMRRGGRGSEARPLLQQGLDAAGRCGAVALAAQGRAELLSAGARPRREALTGPGSLTASERRVADLAAAGRRNREIAYALFVTVKTVEVHLTSVYRKLGISTRAELERALGNGDPPLP